MEKAVTTGNLLRSVFEEHLGDEDARYVHSVLSRVETEFKRWDWSALASEGFSKTGDYCFIFAYPPVRTLEPFPEEEIHRRGEYGSLAEECNVYLHIPYCTAICSYCYFAKAPDKTAPVPRSEYPDLIAQELDIHLARANTVPTVRSIHFGGGTPSLLSEDELNSIMSTLRSRLNIKPDAEITLECAPETIVRNPAILRHMKEAGINRLNLGVESLDDQVLRKMGRRHGAEAALSALDRMFEAGFDNINADIIYGLPGQTLQSWIMTLRLLEQRGLHSLSTYRLRKHPKKAISRLVDSAYPSYDEAMKMQLAHGIVMEDAGFVRSSSHKYGRGVEKLQKQVEEKRGVDKSQLLSLGCGAYGFLNDNFYWNTKSLVEYAAQVRSGKLPIGIGQRLDKDELMRKAMVTGMHTNRGVSVDDFERRFGESPLAVFRAELDRLFRIGVLALNRGYIEPTEVGRLFSDELSLQFYSPNVRRKLEGLGMRYGMFWEKDRYA
jgi:oxygen-independent coproporphyrinogen-3 oxidase